MTYNHPKKHKFKVYLQHDESTRDSQIVISADTPQEASAEAKKKYGNRWFVYKVELYDPTHKE